MLIVFPLGLLATSLAWDIAYLATKNPMWGQIAFWTIVAGVIGAVAAAVPGFADWLAIPERTRAKRTGLLHMVTMVVVLALFVISIGLRSAWGYEAPALGAMFVGWIGIVLAVLGGWLGGELVERMGVGVWEDANLNAPSSLGTRRIRTEQRPLGSGPRPQEPSPRPI